MSSTEIYRLGKEPGLIGEANNAWQGAMFVWNDVARRYCGMDGFSPFGEGAKRVWNSNKNLLMPEWERIVLLSTMDTAIVFAKDAPALIAAFETYAKERGGNIAAQAAIISAATFADGDAIAWNQTSVNGDVWFMKWESEDEDGDAIYKWHDPSAPDGHFNVIAEAAS